MASAALFDPDGAPKARRPVPARVAPLPAPAALAGGRGACACGGTCPRCGGPGGARPLAGTPGEELAPATGMPNPLVERFGRWAGYTTHSGPDFHPKQNPQPEDKPFFRWGVMFGTSLETGTIVQKIESTWWAENCDGTPFTGHDNNATYWESWHVERGRVTEADSATGAHDRWEVNVCDVERFGTHKCPAYAAPTRGVWAIAGTLYTYPRVDLGWARGGHPMSGHRPSTDTEPTQDLGRPMAQRMIGGEWNSCNQDPALHWHRRL